MRRRRLAVIKGLGFAAGAFFFRPDSGPRVTAKTAACIVSTKRVPPLPRAMLDRRSVLRAM